MTAKSLGDVVVEALQKGEDRKLSEEEKLQFYREYYEGVSPKIEQIRAEQRRAYEESQKITLA